MKDIGGVIDDGFDVVRANSEIGQGDIALDNGKAFERRVRRECNLIDLFDRLFDECALDEQKELRFRLCEAFNQPASDKAGKACDKNCLSKNHIGSIILTFLEPRLTRNLTRSIAKLNKKSIYIAFGCVLESLNCGNYMRIEEMRSGFLHLNKKMESERAEDILETRMEREANVSSSADTFASELDEPRWSVISFERTEAAGLTYRQAVRRMNDLDLQGIAGLCIVTDEAASTVKG